MARYVPRPEPGAFPAGLLAVLVHLALAAVLVIGLRWQTKPAEPVSVELVRAETAPSPPAPVVEPPRPVPPPPDPKPEPKVEAPPPPKPAPKVVPKPDIALEQQKKLKEAKEREAKRLDEEKKQEAKLQDEKKRREAEAKNERARLDEQLKRELNNDRAKAQDDQAARELASLKADQARQDAAAKAAAAATAASDSRAQNEWRARIVAKIRPLVLIPDGLSGNPEALFDVVLLPTGDVASARLRRSSGNKAYDDALERAILKASPLPLPTRSEVFSRELRLVFRPNE